MMEFVKADHQDLASVKTLLATCDLPNEDLSAQHLDSFWLLKTEHRIVGTIGLEIHGGQALLRSLAIAPAWRRKGWGKRLLSACEAYAVEIGVSTLYLLTTTAEEYFKAHGYRLIERSAAPETIQRTSEWKVLCPDTAVAMMKVLETTVSRETRELPSG